MKLLVKFARRHILSVLEVSYYMKQAKTSWSLQFFSFRHMLYKAQFWQENVKYLRMGGADCLATNDGYPPRTPDFLQARIFQTLLLNHFKMP